MEESNLELDDSERKCIISCSLDYSRSQKVRPQVDMPFEYGGCDNKVDEPDDQSNPLCQTMNDKLCKVLGGAFAVY